MKTISLEAVRKAGGRKCENWLAAPNTRILIATTRLIPYLFQILSPPLPKYSHENDYNAGILSVEQESTLIIITEFRFELRKTAPGKKVILFVLVRLSGGYEVDLDTQQHVQTTQLMATVWPAEWKPTNHFRL